MEKVILVWNCQRSIDEDINPLLEKDWKVKDFKETDKGIVFILIKE